MDISTKKFFKNNIAKYLSDYESIEFERIERTIKLQGTDCSIEKKGWYIDSTTGRVHLIINVYSNDPSILTILLESIQDCLSIPPKALTFIK